MNNLTSVIIAVLQHLNLLTEDEAKKLIKDLHNKTLPDNYDSALKFVEELFSTHKIKPLENKLNISSLGVELEKLKDDVSKLKTLQTTPTKSVPSVTNQKDLTPKNK